MGDARIVLTTLIDEKLLTPGIKKLYVSYYRKRVYADLLPDGSIRFKDQVYTSPVPCALHMKRTLNPSLKTDAGWSSMYSAASGESLKDIKDRLNIRKRGTNARTAQKEKKAPAPSPTAKERMTQTMTKQQEAMPKCGACRKEAVTDVAECSACRSKTHFKCANPALDASPLTLWFCEKCLTGQAKRILEFLQQTRRVLVERIAEQKQVEEGTEEENESVGVCVENGEQMATEEKDTDVPDSEKGNETIDKTMVEGDSDEVKESSEAADEAMADGDSAEKVKEFNVESTPATLENSSEQEKEATKDEEATSHAIAADLTVPAKPSTELEGVSSASIDALNEKETEQEAIEAVAAGEAEDLAVDGNDKTAKDVDDNTQLVAVKTTRVPSAEEKFLVLIDSLIAEVSSKPDRTNLIANSTGATLVHLEKTQLVQLVEHGKREILAATQPVGEDDEEQEAEAEGDSTSINNSEVDALIKIFDLRHQILSSQSQFQRTTSTLSKRTEKHLRNAESDLMELEEARAAEASTITKVADLINQYSSDLDKCEQKVLYNETFLESILRRRKFIRSTNINDRFVPSYRYSTKLMTTSSDQLLLTVLLDKLRDVTESVNEWTKMERHFEKMTSSLGKSLSLIGTKRKRTGPFVKLPPTPALFAKVKIPPSRRLIERQIANYEVNLNGIRQNRARMRKTLSGILKIAREEHLSDEIVSMTNMLYQRCRDLKAEEEEEQVRLKEEAEAEAKAKEDEEQALNDLEMTDGGAEEPEPKKQRVDTSVSAESGNSSGVISSSTAPPVRKVNSSSDIKGIASILGSEDSDAKELNYSSVEDKSLKDNDDDSEGDLELASQAIADITSSVLPEIPVGSDSRIDLTSSPAKTRTEIPQTFPSQGQFLIRGGKKANDKRDALADAPAARELEKQQSKAPKPSGQTQASFLDQALEALNKQQQQQQRLEEQRLEQQRQLELKQKEIERQQLELEKQRKLEHQQRLEKQRQLEQQRLEQQRLERERQERERQEHQRKERERQERERLEKQRQRLEKQRQEQERKEKQRRELQRLEQERLEQQRLEQQRIEEKRRLESLEEQRRLEQQQKRLEQQRQEEKRLEQQRKEKQRLEQQLQEQQRQEQQRQEQLRQEQQRQEQQRQEQQRRQQLEQQQRLELQRRQQEQQRQEQQRQFQRNKAPGLPQVVPSGSSHLQMLNQQQQLQQQQQVALQQQQHSRQLQHPLYGDLPKGMLMSSGMGSSQQDMYAQQAAQMGMDIHDVVRHQDSSHFVGNASASLRGSPYMPPTEVSRSAAQQPAPTAPRSTFYGEDSQSGQLHSQDVFGSQGLPVQQRQLPDHHMFTNELQQQQPPQSRAMVNQDFLMGRSYRGLNGNNMQHPDMDQTDDNDVDMSDWGQ